MGLLKVLSKSSFSLPGYSGRTSAKVEVHELLSSSSLFGIGMKSANAIESEAADSFSSSPGRLNFVFLSPDSITMRLSNAPTNSFQTIPGLIKLPRKVECASRVPLRRNEGHSPDFGNLPSGLLLSLTLPCALVEELT